LIYVRPLASGVLSAGLKAIEGRKGVILIYVRPLASGVLSAGLKAIGWAFAVFRGYAAI